MSPDYDDERDTDDLWDRVDDAYERLKDQRLDDLDAERRGVTQ